MRTVFFLIALMCLVTTAGVGHAAIYKWVDKNGVTTYRDSPPPQGTETTIVTPKPLSNIEYDSGLTPEAEAKRKASLEAATERAVKEEKSFPKVELYITSWCGYCTRAKAFLRSKNIPFKAYDVERSSQAAKRHRELNPSGGVPVAVIGGQTIRGFSPDLYARALGL